MLSCKRCGRQAFVKSGIVAGKQRYRCKHCKHYFREGDNRTHDALSFLHGRVGGVCQGAAAGAACDRQGAYGLY